MRANSPAERFKVGVISVLLCFVLLVTACVAPCFSPALWLYVTVETDKPIYGLSENVLITGNLTSLDLPAENALVAVEIRDSADIPLSFRTRPTGASPNDNLAIAFTELFASTSMGVPQYSFKRNTYLWVRFTIKNNSPLARNVTTAISVYDYNNAPFSAYVPFSTYLEVNQSAIVVFMAGLIPVWVSLGTATIYGNIYSDLPQNGGYPYCSEKLATFTITSTGSQGLVTSEYTSPNALDQIPGTYEMSLKLPNEGRVGNYTIFVSAYYYGLQDVENTQFEVDLIGDINGDGYVELLDFFLLSQAFGSYPGRPNWDPRCDIYPWPDGDGYVELMDFYLASQHFGDHIPQP